LYYKSPNNCSYCGEVLPYEKRQNNFCNSICSAKHNNGIREYTYTLSETGKKSIINSNKKLFELRLNEYLKNPKKCYNCNNTLSYNKKNNKYCSRCILPKGSPDEYYTYRRKCNFNFNLADYPDEFRFELIKEHGWYLPKNKGNNLYGISRDHMYSVRSGFDNNIDPKIISHPANCRLMLHSENVSKGTDCDITYDELLERIKRWNEKYK
jgi:hypothetical protein